jgi:hypothetical protein
MSRHPTHRPLLAIKMRELDIVLIGTEHLDRHHPVKRGLPTPIHDTEPAAPNGLSIVEALSLKLGNDTDSHAAVSVVGVNDH